MNSCSGERKERSEFGQGAEPAWVDFVEADVRRLTSISAIGCRVWKSEPPHGRAAQRVLLVGRALRARRKHPRMAEMRGSERPQAARSGLRALLPLRPQASWATRPHVGCYRSRQRRVATQQASP